MEEYADWGLNLAGRKAPGSGLVSAAESLGLHPDPWDVMPTGTVAADRCSSCFIIHSTGQVECW